jgi:hypothetical protein
VILGRGTKRFSDSFHGSFYSIAEELASGADQLSWTANTCPATGSPTRTRTYLKSILVQEAASSYQHALVLERHTKSHLPRKGSLQVGDKHTLLCVASRDKRHSTFQTRCSLQALRSKRGNEQGLCSEDRWLLTRAILYRQTS